MVTRVGVTMVFIQAPIGAAMVGGAADEASALALHSAWASEMLGVGAITRGDGATAAVGGTTTGAAHTDAAGTMLPVVTTAQARLVTSVGTDRSVPIERPQAVQIVPKPTRVAMMLHGTTQPTAITT